MKSQSAILDERADANAELNWIDIDVSKDKLDVYELATQSLSTFRNDFAGIEALRQQIICQEI